MATVREKLKVVGRQLDSMRVARDEIARVSDKWAGRAQAAEVALRNLVAAESIPNAEIDMIQARAELAREGNLRSEGVSEETIQARARVLWADVPRLTAEVIRLNAHLAAAKEVLK